MCAVCSQELFNWPVVRGRITYFINFVLDLHRVLKVRFLRNLLTFVYLCTFSHTIIYCLTYLFLFMGFMHTFLSHHHILYMTYLFLFMRFMQSVGMAMIIEFTLKSQPSHSFIYSESIEVF